MTSESSPELAAHPGWAELERLLEALPAHLADIRRPLSDRFGELARIAADLERVALELVSAVIAYRNARWPRPEEWKAGRDRHPQPDPTLLLAVREWVLALGDERGVALDRQKRLSGILTEILVARAGLLVYSSSLRNPPASALVRTLDALWLLVAQCWRLRPLLTRGNG